MIEHIERDARTAARRRTITAPPVPIICGGRRSVLRDIRYDGPVVIESFTPEVRKIARSVSIWRPLAPSQDALARDGLGFLKTAFAA